MDLLAVEHFPLNTSYGLCLNRGSKITIYAPSNLVDPIMGWWAYYVAKIGGFNYVSRELGEKRPYTSFYILNDKDVPGKKKCMDDLNSLLDSEDKWVFTLLAASGANEPAYPTQFHFTYGAKKGDETYDDPDITLNDVPTFDALYKEFAALLENKYALHTDHQRYHNNSQSTNFARKLQHKVNAVSLRVAWSVTARDMRAIQIAQDLASVLNKHIEHRDNPDDPDLKAKKMGY